MVGTFRTPIKANGKDVTRFTMRFPVENSEAEVERLNQFGVEVTGENSRANLTSLLIAVPAVR